LALRILILPSAIDKEAQPDNTDNNIETIELKPNGSGQQSGDQSQTEKYETYNLFFYSCWQHD
jgi:hypothetical protein